MTSEPTFATHEEAAWHKLPHFSLIVPVPDEANYFEQLVCEKMGDNLFRLLCIPFFLKDIALGDVLEGDAFAELEDLHFTVVQRSGRSVFRVWFESGDRKVIEACMTDLKALGALTERSSKRLYAIDAETPAIARAIEAFLQAGEASGKWQYETGYQAV